MKDEDKGVGRNDGFSELLAELLRHAEHSPADEWEREVNALLEEYPAAAEELAPALEAAGWLRMQREVFAPRPGFVSASKSRLMQRVAADQPSNWRQLVDSWAAFFQLDQAILRHVVVPVGALILVMALAFGMIFASSQSLPGESLYTLKRGVENATIALSPTTSGDARLHVTYAHRRLVEMQALVMEGKFEAVPGLSVQFENHVRSAVEGIDALIENDPVSAREIAQALHDTLEQEELVMRMLAQSAPQDAREDLARVQDISERGLKVAEEILLLGSVFSLETLLPSPTPTATAGLPLLITNEPDSRTPATATLTSTSTFVTPTTAPSPTRTPTPTSTSTFTRTPTSTTQVVVPTDAPTSTATSAPTSAPPPTATFTPTSAPPPTDTVAPTSAPEPTSTPTPVPTATRTYTSTPRPTNTPTYTATPRPTSTSTTAPTSAPIETVTLTDMENPDPDRKVNNHGDKFLKEPNIY